jgi:hypothetical protein
VAGLRDVRQQGVVAAVFRVMRVEAAKRPGYRRACPDDSAVDIEGEPRHVQPGQGAEDEVLIELDQRPQLSCVKRRSQLLTVRAVGTRASPEKRRMSG